MAFRRCCSRAPAGLPSPPPLPAARTTLAAAAASPVGALLPPSRGAFPGRAAHNANAPSDVVPAGRVSPIHSHRTVLAGNRRSAAKLASVTAYSSPLLPCCSRNFSGKSNDVVLGYALAAAALPQGHRLYSSVEAAGIETTTTSAAEGPSPADLARLPWLRNIGISAHIDSGKTTLTERVLFYTGRINEIHDVKGRDGVGAKMDSMDLEREKGITIQSAATYCDWGDYSFNIIDTPGHIDFTIEVERALRVLDGAILVVCAVSGIQSQTISVDRQMKRYNVPRLTFVNKMDRAGADPFRVVAQVKDKLRLGAAAVQIPIGKEDDFQGVVDLVAMKAYYNEGLQGEKLITKDIPTELMSLAQQKRKELIEALADVDEQIADQFLVEETPTSGEIMAAIRRATLSLQFTPVFMGSAFKNKSVQPLLDAVGLYLPNPTEVSNQALDFNQNEAVVSLKPYSNHDFVGLAFKLEDGPFGQLSYMRIYQGKLSKGDTIYNAKDRKKVKVSRLVRIHANEMEEVSVLGAGEICALLGLECASGDTFTSGNIRYGMTSMFVPEPVVSLSVTPVHKDTLKLGKALSRFAKEDPTFRAYMDPDSKETIISGMGELHLEIYIERMRREYGVPCTVGRPRVAYRETITTPQAFDYLHKRQSGGAGQYARVVGRLEPMEPTESGEICNENSFENHLVGMAIPAEFIGSVHKGMKESVKEGPLIGQPVIGVRMILEDGVTHVVDSSDLAFRIAAKAAFKEAFLKASPIILEPVMTVTVCAPNEFHGDVLGSVNRRKATILNTVSGVESFELTCHVTLNAMFGYSSELRSITQGKGEFTMEYWTLEPCMKNDEMSLIEDYAKEKEKGKK